MQLRNINISGGLQLWPSDPVFTDPYFENTTMLLPGNGTNNGTNNTFLDGSTNNFTITRNGNTTQGTFSPYSQTGWSNYFDGTGDYLNTPANAAFTFGTGDLTLECWIYQTATSTSTYRVIFGDDVYGSVGGYTLYSYNNALNLWKGSAGGGAEVIAPAGTINLNTWTHVAWTRSGSSNRLFINGTQVGATTTDSTNFTSTAMYIAASRLGTFAFAGYISNARALKGTALYTSNFTPPTAPLTAIANTSLLTCQSNRFQDNSTNNFTITRSGDTSVQSFSPFSPSGAYAASTNGGSAYFDGTGDYLSIADNIALEAFDDFTIEGWVYFNSAADSQVIVNKGWDAASTYSPYIIYTSSGNLVFTASTNGSSWGVLAATIIPSISIGRWYYFAVTRSGSTIRYFNNGALTGTSTLSGALMDSSYALTIGSHRTGGFYLNGYLSGLRMVKGTAVYTAAFTPPTSPVTAIANTSLLCNFTNGQITDATSKNDLETIADAKISTTQSKWGGSSMFFDGVDDYLTKPHDNILNFDDGNFTIESWIYPTSTSGEGIASKGFASTGAWLFWIQTGQLRFRIYSAAATSVTVTSGVTTVTANTWSHVAAVRNGSTITLYLNGTDVGSDSYTGTGTNSSLFTLGCYNIGSPLSPTAFYDGYINDFRITRGLARYTSNFTPPTAAFPKL